MVNKLMRARMGDAGYGKPEGKCLAKLLNGVPEAIGSVTLTVEGSPEWISWTAAKRLLADGRIRITEYEQELVDAHTDEPDGPGFVCEVCGRRYGHSLALRGHVSSHAPRKQTPAQKAAKAEREAKHRAEVGARRKRKQAATEARRAEKRAKKQAEAADKRAARTRAAEERRAIREAEKAVERQTRKEAKQAARRAEWENRPGDRCRFLYIPNPQTGTRAELTEAEVAAKKYRVRRERLENVKRTCEAYLSGLGELP